MEIIYEDTHLLAVNKSAGELVQGDKTGDKCLLDTLKMYIKTKYHKPGNVFLGVPQRIDRPTTGVVLFAKSSKYLARLCEMFQHKEVQMTKIYWAIVKNRPPKDSGRLVDYLRKNEQQNKSYVVPKSDTDKNVKEAILEYKVLAKSDNYYLLEIHLFTGRHHQIRCQLAHIGCPIKGDLKYGFPRSNKDGSICLHARELSFEHPTTHERITITAPTPNDNLWNSLTTSL